MPDIEDRLRDYCRRGMDAFRNRNNRKARWYLEKVRAEDHVSVLDSRTIVRVQDVLRIIDLIDKVDKEAATAQEAAKNAHRVTEGEWVGGEDDQRKESGRAANVARTSATMAKRLADAAHNLAVTVVSADAQFALESLVEGIRRYRCKVTEARLAAEHAYQTINSTIRAAPKTVEKRKISQLAKENLNTGIAALRREDYDAAVRCFQWIVGQGTKVEPDIRIGAQYRLKVINLTRVVHAVATEAQTIADNVISDASGPWDSEDDVYREAAERAAKDACDSAQAVQRAAERIREIIKIVMEEPSVDDSLPTAVARACGDISAESDAMKAARQKVEEARRRASESATTRWQETRTAIDTEIKDRGINRLVHFTRVESLRRIVQDREIASTGKLMGLGRTVIRNDHERLDGRLDYVCCSVQYPNVYVLNRYCQQYTGHEWVILFLDRSLLLLSSTKFSPVNAATGNGQYVQDGARGFRALFDDRVPSRHETYRSPRHRDDCPTDIQAEVLVKGAIPWRYVTGMAVHSKMVAAGIVRLLHDRSDGRDAVGRPMDKPKCVVEPRLFDPIELTKWIRRDGW